MSVLNQAASGTAAGASIGSVFPGVGTAIGGVVGGLIGGIGSIFGGNSRSEKRKARQQYWDFLTGQGVKFERVHKWHSDQFKAGQGFVKIYEIAPNPRIATQYINEVVPIDKRITAGYTQQLAADFPAWLRNFQKSIVSTQTSGGQSVTAAGFNNPILWAGIAAVGLLIFGGLK